MDRTIPQFTEYSLNIPEILWSLLTINVSDPIPYMSPVKLLTMKENVAVILFLRYPKPGQVKSRLAKSIGTDLACQVYEQCAIRTLQSILSNSGAYSCFIFFSVSDEEEAVKEWLGMHGCLDSIAGCRPQLQSDCLGDRLVDAFQYVSSLGYHNIAVVGTDIPDLTAEILQQGIEELTRSGVEQSALLGPSIDGGFYMMILASNDPTSLVDGLNLDDVKWSTSSVYEDTSKALIAGGYNVLSRAEADVPDLRDIDELEDLFQWYHSLNKTRSHEMGALERLVEGITNTELYAKYQ